MKILIIAPHPDDETLGCGGTLLKHYAQGDEVHWLIMSKMTQKIGYSDQQIALRQKEIEEVCDRYQFKKVWEFDYTTAMLDIVPRSALIKKITEVVSIIVPEVVYLPNRSDIHSDHKIVFETAMGAIKTFRAPFVRKILAYEVLSETEFSYPFSDNVFIPNYFSDISDYLDQKILIMECYKRELGAHPFPRSKENIRALATLRGATAGVRYAEAFMLLKEIT